MSRLPYNHTAFLSPIRLNPTDEVEALIGNPPTWIIRWGIIVIGFIVAALVIMSFIIKFPDTIEAKVVLTTQNPPIRIMALSNGKISQLLVRPIRKLWIVVQY